MVAAGGGRAEREQSIGGNGGDIEGGTSTYNTNFKCKGATQTSSVDCGTLYDNNISYQSVPGSFGSGGIPIAEDIGGLGGGGYYGGTSFPLKYAGSGGSSFISGYGGCKAVKDPQETDNEIIHTDDSIHYSNIVFTLSRMISGNHTMPLPDGNEGIFDSNKGAFRITYLSFPRITCKKQPKYFSQFSIFIYNTISF